MTTTTIAAPDELGQHIDAEPSPTLAENIAAGLRALADFIAANPDLPALQYVFDRTLISVFTREAVAAYALAGARGRARVAKHQSDKYAGVDLHFGPAVSLHVYAAREEVCERIVVGTREVVEEVPDPELLAAVPKVTKTTTVEDVEWRCGSLLAPGGAE